MREPRRLFIEYRYTRIFIRMIKSDSRAIETNVFTYTRQLRLNYLSSHSFTIFSVCARDMHVCRSIRRRCNDRKSWMERLRKVFAYINAIKKNPTTGNCFRQHRIEIAIGETVLITTALIIQFGWMQRFQSICVFSGMSTFFNVSR